MHDGASIPGCVTRLSPSAALARVDGMTLNQCPLTIVGCKHINVRYNSWPVSYTHLTLPTTPYV